MVGSRLPLLLTGLLVLGSLVGCADTKAARWHREPALSTDVREELTPDGTLTGFSLRLGRVDGTTLRTVELPTESFVEPPFAGKVVFGSDDGLRSRVQVWTPDEGVVTVLTSDEVVRHAALGPTGRDLWAFTLERGTRAPLGLLRVPLHPPGAALRVLPARDSDPDLGLRLGTRVVRSLDGDAMAVQACGTERCATRVLDLASGAISTFDAPEQGPLLGLSRDSLVVRSRVDFVPSPIQRIDRASARQNELSGAAYQAVVLREVDGAVSVVLSEPAAERGMRTLRRVQLATLAPRGGDVRHDGYVRTNVELAPGWLAVASEAGPTRLLSLADGRWFEPERAEGR